MTGRVLLDADDVERTVERLARQISATFGDGLVLVGLLPGSVIFLADLLRRLSVSAEVDFLAVTAYRPGGSRIRFVKDLDGDISDRDVLVVDAAVDTGLMLSYVLGELERRDPRSLDVCALVDKVRRRLVPIDIRFCGASVDAELVAGYGLGQSGAGMNLGHIVEVAG